MKIIKKKIYSLKLRVIHGAIALLTLSLFLSFLANYFSEFGHNKNLWDHYHINLGHFFIIAIILRISLGYFENSKFILGRFSQLWRKKRTKDSDLYHFGHFQSAKIFYLAFYFLTLVLIVSGLLLASMVHGIGLFKTYFFDHTEYLFLIKKIHFASSLFVLAFFIIHMIGIYKAKQKLKLPIIQSMFKGYQYKYKEKET